MLTSQGSNMAEIGVPPRCVDTCILAQRNDLEERGIVLTRNCKGPRESFGDIQSHVQIDRNGVAKEVGQRTLKIVDGNSIERTVEFLDSSNGELVCRNPGANRSIERALNKGNEV